MMLRLLIALLLFAAAPPVLAQVSAPAADSLLQQLQAQKIEAEARAAEAEKREREAEINRLTEQARQEKFRADAEAQLKSAAQRELYIQEAKSALDNSAYARLEILIGAFGALITAIVVFFAWNTKDSAVAAAKAGVEEIEGKLDDRLKKSASRLEQVETRLIEAEAVLAKLKGHETRLAGIGILANYSPGKTLKSEVDRKTIANAAMVALTKLPRDRTVDDYRTIIINAQALENWPEMLEAAQQMRLMHGDADADFALARLCEGYALYQMNRFDEAIAAFEYVIERYGSVPETTLREVVARAFYNKAYAYAKEGRVAEAITALRGMIKVGHAQDLKRIADETNFDPIREHPEFKKFLEENKGA